MQHLQCSLEPCFCWSSGFQHEFKDQAKGGFKFVHPSIIYVDLFCRSVMTVEPKMQRGLQLPMECSSALTVLLCIDLWVYISALSG